MGKIKIIYADPPWHYNDRALAGKRGASCKYPVMSVDDIKNLKIQLPKKHYRNSLFIKDIAHKNCCLFLWATAPQLPVAFDVIKAWGFDYKTIAFTWVKKTKNGKSFIGMGHYTRANAELCLLATRGKVEVLDHSISQIVETIPEKHSKKPDVIRDLIVKLCGRVPRIELFARQQTKGWLAWGNQL